MKLIDNKRKIYNMIFFEYIGEFFSFRWLFGRARRTGRQEMPGMDVPYRDNYMDYERYCDMGVADCFGHYDYDCQEDFLDEQDDCDMIDDDF